MHAFAIELEENKTDSREGTPKLIGRVLKPVSPNPYPIYDQNLLFSQPSLCDIYDPLVLRYSDAIGLHNELVSTTEEHYI